MLNAVRTLDERIDEIRTNFKNLKEDIKDALIDITKDVDELKEDRTPSDQTERVAQTTADKDKIIDIVDIDGAEVREILAVPLIENQNNTREQQIAFLEQTNLPHWEELEKEARKQGNEKRAPYMKSAVELTRLKADEMRLKYKIKGELSAEGEKIIRESDRESIRAKLAKFKDWAKQNLLALSGAVITVASIITSIALAAQSALRAGASSQSSHLIKYGQ